MYADNDTQPFCLYNHGIEIFSLLTEQYINYQLYDVCRIISAGILFSEQ